jgi:hypothetical protein
MAVGGEPDVTRKSLAPGGMFATVVCLIATGCGGSPDLPLTKVSGRVTFSGGPPPAVGSIAFSLVPGTGAEGLPYRPGSAPFGTGGQFVVNSFSEGDGLLPGTYKVRITCLSGPPSSGPLESLSYVPLDWAPEELVIKGDEQSVVVKYDVPPKKSR